MTTGIICFIAGFITAWGAEPDKQYYILEISDKEKLAADEKRVGDEQLEK